MNNPFFGILFETLQIKILNYTSPIVFGRPRLNIFVFDIETVPDADAGRKLHSLHGLSDEDVVMAMTQMRIESHGSEFLPHYLQKIVAISAVLKTKEQLKVWSLGEPDSTEADLINRFFKGIERFTPTLVSWNGSGFDLPVIHYRALIHGVSSPLYWETTGDFKWNNYLNRYHERHTDLMDILSAYQGKAAAPLDKIAQLCGFPGKMGMDGHQVWQRYHQNDIIPIRNYCETDVLNTYLLYLRYQLLRGHLTSVQYEEACQEVKDVLGAEDKAHFKEFLNAWNQSSQPSLT